jgi:hypothetical protein
MVLQISEIWDCALHIYAFKTWNTQKELQLATLKKKQSNGKMNPCGNWKEGMIFVSLR